MKQETTPAPSREFPFNATTIITWTCRSLTAVVILMAALVVIEVTDVLFAIDSIPAVFSVTSQPFIVYSSNVFAILGSSFFSARRAKIFGRSSRRGFGSFW